MQGYGPISVTQGVVSHQTVDPSADRVLISNRSVYDVLVSFQSTQPLADVACSPRWPVFVHAGDQVVYTLRNADKTPTPLLLQLTQFWSGNVWVCPIGVQPNLALTGTASGSNQVFFLALHPGDETPTLAARPTSTDLSSQPRVVAIPASGGSLYTAVWNMTAGTHQFFFFNQLLTAQQIAAGVAYLYVYYLYVAAELATSPQLGASRIAAFYQMTDVNNLIIGSATNFMFFTIAQLYNTTNNSLFLKDFTYSPAQPPFIQITVPANAVHLFVGVQLSTGIQYPAVDVIASAALDVNNVVALAPIGNTQQNYYPNVVQANSPIF